MAALDALDAAGDAAAGDDARWSDWWNGTTYRAGDLPPYASPLGTLPLFARAGAIVPMWPAGADVATYRADWGAPTAGAADPMLVELWPSGATAFDLYEDDGVTRDALGGPRALPAAEHGGGAAGCLLYTSPSPRDS